MTRRMLEVLPQNHLIASSCCSDPWPKVRHAKRRLLNHETLAMLARVHKKNGRFLLATDHIDYSGCVSTCSPPALSLDGEKAPADFLTPPADWTVTKYQRKTTEQGRLPQFLSVLGIRPFTIPAGWIETLTFK